MTTLAKLVGVECSASGASPGTYQRAFLSASEAANARTGRRCSGYRQLISVLLPETARMTVAAVAGLRRCVRHGESQYHKHQYYDQKLFHAVPLLVRTTCVSGWQLETAWGCFHSKLPG
jgi:hypothetical protein